MCLARSFGPALTDPSPYEEYISEKPGISGETRPLGIPCVRDRVAMAAAKLVLEPIFEADLVMSR
ncbi:hypothetical protein [Ferrithrix thermotolerans]|uniref:hypothetical protein n=1 Tax=Ferrithrix thermotolerans TaxID=209649 RepID=UPI001160C30D|nr:hypothetical protein [Ferrithrix thermotolerans]